MLNNQSQQILDEIKYVNAAIDIVFSHLSIRRQCDVFVVSIAAVLYHQHWCILHRAHQKDIPVHVFIIIIVSIDSMIHMYMHAQCIHVYLFLGWN